MYKAEMILKVNGYLILDSFNAFFNKTEHYEHNEIRRNTCELSGFSLGGDVFA